MRVMSYNIRMAPCVDDDDTENSWEHRLPKVAMILSQYFPDITGIQEVSLQQMSSLKQKLSNFSYQFLGKYPTKKPIEAGLGIVYNKTKIEQVSDLHTVWLNEDQTQPNASAWDGSSYERYIIYAKFRHVATKKTFWFLTTHFDHLGVKARQESAKIVMDKAMQLDAPAIITGDFNCFPQLGGAELYQLLCSRSTYIKDSGLTAKDVFGVPGSWIGWSYDEYRQQEGHAKYDFIFVHDSLEVEQHGVIDDQVWDDNFGKELYPSDHRPVLSDVCFMG